MDSKQKRFVDWLITSCKDHHDWLTVVQFGLPTLLKDQDVLLEVIINEAKRDVADQPARGGRAVSHEVKPASVARILKELGLRFEAVG